MICRQEAWRDARAVRPLNVKCEFRYIGSCVPLRLNVKRYAGLFQRTHGPCVPTFRATINLSTPFTRRLSTELIINDLNLTFQTHPFCAPIWVRLACKMAHITVQNR